MGSFAKPPVPSTPCQTPKFWPSSTRHTKPSTPCQAPLHWALHTRHPTPPAHTIHLYQSMQAPHSGHPNSKHPIVMPRTLVWAPCPNHPTPDTPCWASCGGYWALDPLCPTLCRLPGALHGTPGTLCQAPLAVLVPRVPVTPYLSPQAMSCSDGQHCCPQGTSVPCPLCCAPPCPHPQGSLSSHVSHQAVCCSDGQHCCPQGTTCDLVHSTCTSLGGSAPLAPLPRGKTPAGSNHPPVLPRGGNTRPDYPLSPAHDVKCDEVTSCPDGNTCCRLSSGAWGCCPLEQVRGSPVPPRTNRCFLSSWVG